MDRNQQKSDTNIEARLLFICVEYIPEHALDPGDDFVGRGVGGLVLVGVSMRSDCERMILNDQSRNGHDLRG